MLVIILPTLKRAKSKYVDLGVSYSYHKDIIKEEPDFMIDGLLDLLEEKFYV